MYTYEIKLDRVVDGDTIDTVIDLGFGIHKNERVRVAGIDTPESRTRDLEEKKLGLEAKYYLEKILGEADSLFIKTSKEGKYGRLLGWIFTSKDLITDDNQHSVNQIMIDEGYAWPYDGGTKEKNMQVLEKIRKQTGTFIEG